MALPQDPHPVPPEAPASGAAEAHARQMAKLKAVVDRRIAAAQEEKGLLMVHTGAGKGKTTAAMGMLVRSLGHGFPCAVVQFIKGPQPTAEQLLTRLAELTGARLQWDRCGEGFTWNTQDQARDAARAREGWALVRTRLADPELRFLLLDELNLVLARGWLDPEAVVRELQARPRDLHVVITGRGAPDRLLAAADLVTEMREVKHPFRAGIKAQAGIEF